MLVQDYISDEELLSKLKDDDYSSFTIIYNRHWKFLYNSAYNILRHHDDTLDVCQSIFIWLWENRSTINVKSTLKGYLYTAVKYKIANLIRDGRVREELLEQADLSDIKADEIVLIEIKELKHLINQLINQLPNRCREIFIMSREQNLTHKEIARRLNISEKTVDEHINRALKRLRISLTKLASLIILL